MTLSISTVVSHTESTFYNVNYNLTAYKSKIFVECLIEELKHMDDKKLFDLQSFVASHFSTYLYVTY
jgi:hypothetical protein